MDWLGLMPSIAQINVRAQQGERQVLIMRKGIAFIVDLHINAISIQNQKHAL
jgi:hypothetical protein